jgi:predicted Zn-dependent protease
VAPKGVLEHTLAAARSRVLMDPRTDALRRWQALDGDRISRTLAGKLASAYSSALASSMLRDWSRADASIANAQALLRGAPAPNPRAERWVELLEVDSALARGATARAAQALQPLLGENSRPVLLERAEVTLAMGASADPAALTSRADELQTWVAVNPHDALAWTALAQVWGRLNRPLRAMRAEAESRAAVGDLSGAADRLRAGQRLARAGTGAMDFIDVSVIDARLRDIEAQRKLIAADERNAR